MIASAVPDPASDPGLEVIVADPAWTGALGDAAAVVASALAAARAQTGAQGGALAVVLADDAQVAALNARWRGKSGPTDVLSFPASPDAGAEAGLGDVVLAFETVEAAAAARGLALADHLSHLVIHGFLHLLGHDHVDEEPARVMETIERDALARLGVADPAVGDRRAALAAGADHDG